MSKLEEIKNDSHMNIKSGLVIMKVEHRDWLIKTVEQLLNEKQLGGNKR